MVDGSTRRLPNWLAVGDEDKKANKKKTAGENTPTEENLTLPRNSVSLANSGTKRKKRNDNLPHATVNVSRGKRKGKAKTVHEEIEDEDALTVENKKTTAGENKLTEENLTQPRNSVSLANNGTKRKKGKPDDLPHATVNVSGGNKRKRKAKNVHEEIEDEDALTVEDLVSIAQEYVKYNDNSERSLLLSRINQPYCSNDLDGSNEQQFSSGETSASIDSTVNLTSEQSFSNFSRTDDPAQDMLNLFLGPLLLGKP
ncbi:uncharacterized protein [Euphorbia lathyris]|uniref:uncharacterized protein n=1 Tax=Euphorbia lathyris TaxID=212925 RepID=UPI0033142659